MNITYITGDATRPQGEGKKIIAHICNDIGGWGSGFVLHISRRWTEPERSYRDWFRNGKLGEVPFKLGQCWVVSVGDDIAVANMIAQHGFGFDGNPPIRYDALKSCLEIVLHMAQLNLASVHMPRIGCGLAGGDWRLVEPIIQRTLCDKGIAVTVYDLPKR